MHNGAIIRAGGRFHYVYRGERSCEPIDGIDYICKIGLAESADGLRFTRITSDAPLFGADDPFSYEDVSLVRLGETFHLFCNRWDWERIDDPAVSGCWLATSTDLRHWTEHGLVYPDAERIHRNGVVLCDPDNRPVRVDGHYLMYAEARYPHESGCSASDPARRVSPYRDCIFFNGVTRYDGRWWIYYGGSEYYTCVATAPIARRRSGPR